MEISALNSLENSYGILNLQNDALTPVRSTAKISEIEAEANKKGFSIVDDSVDNDNDGVITSQEIDTYFEFAQNFISSEQGNQKIEAKTYNDIVLNNAIKSYNASYSGNIASSTFSLKV